MAWSGGRLDQVNLPQMSQRRLHADSPGPQLLSCGCARYEPVTTIGTTSWSCLLTGHVGQPAAGEGGGHPDEGDAEGTHGSIERKA